MTFDVLAIWKGPVAEELSVVTAIDCGLCGIHFQVGREYVVYTNGGEAHSCSRTRGNATGESDALGPPCASVEGGLDGPLTHCPGPVAFRRADANDDGARNIADAVFILLHLFSGSESPSCLKALDANDSGVVNIADAIHVLNYLFSPDSPVLPPSSVCGFDLTEDALDCEGFTACEDDLCDF